MALDFWDSLFDVDGDGKITDFDFDLDYFLYDQVMNDENNNGNACLDDDDYSWREYAEDGSEYGLYPEDFEYEYDYEEALEAAREAAELGEVAESEDGGPSITIHITDEMVERMKTEDPETVLREGAYKQLKEIFSGLLGEDTDGEQEPTDEE